MARRRIDDVLQVLSGHLGRRRWIGAGLVALLLAALIAGCAPSVPERQQDLCAVFQQHPDWYDYAKDAADEWGVPIPVLMAFVHHESSFRSDARPPRKYVLWIIPWGHVSSAKGYAQAQDPAWSDYTDQRGSLFRSRSDMEDALDFIGWYNHGTSRELGIAKTDARNLYLAYHEGAAATGRAAGKGSRSCSASPSGWPRPRGATRRRSSAANQNFAATPGGRCGPSVADRRPSILARARASPPAPRIMVRCRVPGFCARIVPCSARPLSARACEAWYRESGAAADLCARGRPPWFARPLVSRNPTYPT